MAKIMKENIYLISACHEIALVRNKGFCMKKINFVCYVCTGLCETVGNKV